MVRSSDNCLVAPLAIQKGVHMIHILTLEVFLVLIQPDGSGGMLKKNKLLVVLL